MPRPFLAAATLIGIATLAGITFASAQSDFPNRTIRFVVPFAPGGGVDTLGRLVAEKLQARVGQTVIIENRAGANGTIGGQAVMQAAPDGYTLLFTSVTHTMAKLVLAKPPYDPLADFTPIARVGEVPLVVVISPQLPQKTLGEVAAAAKQNPDRWTAGTPALGSPSHIATIAFSRLANVKLTITPYRGTAPALTDVAGGHIQMLTDAVIALLPMARSGQVKAVALTTAKRSALAPEIPTAAESGLPGLEVAAWFGLWGPKGMSPDVVKKLNEATAAVLRELTAEGKLAAIGVEPISQTPEEFAAHTAAEVARNAELLKSVDFQPQ